MENRRFFKKTLAGIASVAMLAGMVPADFMVSGSPSGLNLEFTWDTKITEDHPNVSVTINDKSNNNPEIVIEDELKLNVYTAVESFIDYTEKNGYYVVKLENGKDYSVAKAIIDPIVEEEIEYEFPNYDGNKLLYGDIYQYFLSYVIAEYYYDFDPNSSSSGYQPKCIEKSYRVPSLEFDYDDSEGEDEEAHILSECLPNNKIRYTAVVWDNNVPYTSSVTVNRSADEDLNEAHKPKLSEKKTGEAPDCAYEYYECEYCGAEVDENGEEINKYDGSTWHDIDETNADISWDYTDTSNPKATIKYKCENEKIKREFTISYKQYTGEEALGEGMSFTTIDEEKYIVGPYKVLAMMENVSEEASCYDDVQAKYIATFGMYLGQYVDEYDENGNGDKKELLDWYTAPKTGSIEFPVAKTGHKAKEGTRVEAKEPTDLKSGNKEFYLCDNDKDEGTIVIVDETEDITNGGFRFVNPEDNTQLYCAEKIDSQTIIYTIGTTIYTYNFKTQKFECKGKDSISAIPEGAYVAPLWYGYTVKEGKLVTPEGYIAESHECEIYPHYAYYYYEPLNQYIIEKPKGEKNFESFESIKANILDTTIREFIDKDDAEFDEFGILKKAHTSETIKHHEWSNFKACCEIEGLMFNVDEVEVGPTYVMADYIVQYNQTLENIRFEIENGVWKIKDIENLNDSHLTFSYSFDEDTGEGNIIIYENGAFLERYDLTNLKKEFVLKDGSLSPTFSGGSINLHQRKCTNPGCTAIETHQETGTYIPTSAGHFVFGSACSFEYEQNGETKKCGIDNTYESISELFESISDGIAVMLDHEWVDANAEYLVCADCGYTKKNDAPSVKTTSNSISLAELDGKEGYRQTYTFDINSNGKEIAYYGVVYNKDTRNIKGLKAENLECDNKGEFTVPTGYKFEKRTAIKNKGTLTVNLTSDSEDKYVTVMGYVVYMVDGKYEIATTEVNVNTFEMKAEDEFNNACSIKLAENTWDNNNKKAVFKYDIETSEGFTLVKYGCMVDKEYNEEASKSKIETASYDKYQTDGKILVKTEATKIKSNGTYTVNVKSTDNSNEIAAKAFIIVKDKYGIEHYADDTFDTVKAEN